MKPCKVQSDGKYAMGAAVFVSPVGLCTAQHTRRVAVRPSPQWVRNFAAGFMA